VTAVRGLEPHRKPALLISECQRGILDPTLTSLPALATQAAERGILPRIAQLAEAFRPRRLPVLHIHIGHRPDFAGCAVTSPLMGASRKAGKMVAGTPDAEPMPDVMPVDSDIVCSRRSGLAMWYGTDLDAMLRNERVDTLVMVGVSTNVALFGGSLGGVDRGYEVVIAEDCTAGGSVETHEFMIANSLPLLATMTNADAVIESLSAR
jgi:nicotinamidase-related amidase